MMLRLLCIASLFLAGCYQGRPSEDPPIHLNPNMDSQPKYEAQEKSTFFVDGATMRMPVEGTIARGELYDDEVYYLGRMENGQLVSKIPIPVTMQMLKRGQERYNIYCAPCHDKTGAGQGIVIKKGYLPPPSFHLDRLRTIEDGHLYDVIKNGIRNMPAYNHQISVDDRWAIVAFVRALQRSQNARAQDVPEEIRKKLKESQ